MCDNDYMEDSEYYDEWLERKSDFYGTEMTFEEFEYQCQVRDYGLTDEEAYCGDEDDDF